MRTTETVTIPYLAKMIKDTAREARPAYERDMRAEWEDDLDAKCYAEHRRFLHREWPALRRGIIDADYATRLSDLVADQGSMLAFCIKHRQRQRR